MSYYDEVNGLNASYYVNFAGSQLSKSVIRLSSGSRLADPSDDAAAVGIVAKFNSLSSRLSAVADGANHLISFAQTGLGVLSTIQDELSRMSELAVRATNGAYSQSDRLNYHTEFLQLASAITTQVTNATFNGAAVFQTGSVGVTSTAVITPTGFQYSLVLSDLRDQTGTGLLSGIGALQISSTAGASGAVTSITSHIDNISAATANYASAVSVLTFHVNNAQIQELNINEAKSRISDLDFALESVRLAKYTILSQSATAMLSQANLSRENVLKLVTK